MIKLVDVFNLILEGAYDAQGVGDKAYEKFYIKTDEPNLKTLGHMQKEKDKLEMSSKIVGKVNGDAISSYIYLNPIDLSKFEKNVRGIADEHGNLYLPQRDGDFDHWDIADALGIDMYSTKLLKLVRIRNGNNFMDVTDYGDETDYKNSVRAFRKKHPKLGLLSKF